MIEASRNTAEIEYAVMLAVLDFQTEFMKSNYARADVRVSGDRLHVTLTRTGPIPAEDLLAQSPDGRALLEQVHGALFHSGETQLRRRIELALGVKVESLSSRLDTVAGMITIDIGLAENLLV